MHAPKELSGKLIQPGFMANYAGFLWSIKQMPTSQPQLVHRCSNKPTPGNAWTVEPRLEAATYMNMDLPMEDIVKKVVEKAEQSKAL